MGPGPSNAHARVLAAQALPLLGHMHPAFFQIMDEIQSGLRYLFQTDSPYALLVSGTGHAGMEVRAKERERLLVAAITGRDVAWGDR